MNERRALQMTFLVAVGWMGLGCSLKKDKGECDFPSDSADETTYYHCTVSGEKNVLASVFSCDPGFKPKGFFRWANCFASDGNIRYPSDNQISGEHGTQDRNGAYGLLELGCDKANEGLWLKAEGRFTVKSSTLPEYTISPSSDTFFYCRSSSNLATETLDCPPEQMVETTKDRTGAKCVPKVSAQ